MFQSPLLDGIPRDIAAVADYASYARRRLDDNAWAYLDGAAADELTRGWNRRAFDHLALLPRVMADVAGGHCRTTLFGRELPCPILLAPVAWQKLFHPDGELATAYVAAALGVGMVLSTLASCSIEEVAAAAGQGGDGPRWFQLYLQPERSLNEELVRRAEAAGYEAIVFTVDASLNGIRNREQRVGFQLPPGIEAVNLRRPQHPDDAEGLARRQRSLAEKRQRRGPSNVFDDLMHGAPTWADLDWLVATTRLPVIVKGVLHPDDAARAVDQGAAGIVVSNHGGRTLDTLPASLDALPAIAQRLGGRVPILLDGGIQRGTDIFKAIALGASAVLIGRPYIHALAAAGPFGIAHVLRLLQDELEASMALCGVASLERISPAYLIDNPYWRTPS
ncbi:MAG: alpha-hydroxy-acid oxidizing protein [Dechloromonas sp.]|nr:alpha-hydroxy-acid oxidizing protein [Dechloromonas sp.]